MSEPNRDSTDSAVIEPTQWRPTATQGSRRRPPLRAATVVLGLAFAVLAAVAWYLFAAESVLIAFEPEAESVGIEGGPSFHLGSRYLLLPGRYTVQASRPGYVDFERGIEIMPGHEQPLRFELQRLPGVLAVTSRPVDGARVMIDGADAGRTPLAGVELDPGGHQLTVEAPRYQPATGQIQIDGKGIEQALAVELEPDWANVTVQSEPSGAYVSVGGTRVGETPLTAEVLSGARSMTVKLEGYKAWSTELDVEARKPMELPTVQLERADGLLRVHSEPAAATVTVDGNYRGRSPLEIDLAPGTDHAVELFKTGYTRASRTVDIESGAQATLDVRLDAMLGKLRVAAQPADAELIVDGRNRGAAAQTLELPAVTHEVEIHKRGYVPYRTSVTPRPGHPQAIDVDLMTVEEARRASIETVIETPAGQTLRLIRPGALTMGASRREPGRRANEVLREVTLTRPFYISVNEVTNEQFRRFASEHDSGEFEDFDLDGDEQPVVGVSWQEAALYCNWLSRQDGLATAYIVENGEVTGFDAEAKGYRLPTEAEWAWVARSNPDGEPLKFAWGQQMPPPPRFGNFADRAASHLLGRTIMNYTDGQVVSAPVGSYEANAHGVYDIGGNVAEWTNDFYAATSESLASGEVDPLGPASGDYHVIRGSSWMHGTVTDLRLSFRDYGADGRQDVGFRIARYLE